MRKEKRDRVTAVPQRLLRIPELAQVLGYSVFHVERWGEEPKRLGGGRLGSPLPASAIPIITAETGDKSLIEFLCGECGGLFVQVPESPCMGSVARVVAEFGEFLTAVAEEEICSGKIQRIKHEGREAASAILGLIKNCELSEI